MRRLRDWTRHISWNGALIDVSKYLNKKHIQTSGPNKIAVAVCWFAVTIAFMIAFLKIVFRVF
jgi:hypothetical protein